MTFVPMTFIRDSTNDQRVGFEGFTSGNGLIDEYYKLVLR